MRTNVEQDGTIVLLVDDVVLEHLVIQGLRRFHSSWHVGMMVGCYRQGATVLL